MSNPTTSLTEDETAIRSVPGRITAAWAANDAQAFADAFAPDGTMILPGDVFLKGRPAIHDFMSAAYAGPYQGTGVTGQPLDARLLGAGAAVVVTQGGVLAAGASEVAATEEIRATWVLAKYGDDWLISAYHNSRIAVS